MSEKTVRTSLYYSYSFFFSIKEASSAVLSIEDSTESVDDHKGTVQRHQWNCSLMGRLCLIGVFLLLHCVAIAVLFSSGSIVTVLLLVPADIMIIAVSLLCNCPLALVKLIHFFLSFFLKSFMLRSTQHDEAAKQAIHVAVALSVFSIFTILASVPHFTVILVVAPEEDVTIEYSSSSSFKPFHIN